MYRYRRKVIGVATITVFAIVIIANWDNIVPASSGRASSSFTTVATPAGEFKEYSFRLLGRAKETRSRGHPHSPFGTSGKNSYVYSGKISFGDVHAALTVEDMKPIKVVSVSGNYYCLTKGAFLGTAGEMQWMVRDGDSFRNIEFTQVPEQLLFMKWESQNDEYCARGAMLNGLVLEGRPDLAFARSVLIHRHDRHWLLAIDDTAGGYDRGSLLDCVKSLARTEHADEIYRMICENFDRAGPTDNRLVLAILMSMLQEIDPDRAHDFLCEFKKRVFASGNPRDNRQTALNNEQQFLQLNCDRPKSPSTTRSASD